MKESAEAERRIEVAQSGDALIQSQLLQRVKELQTALVNKKDK